MTTSHNEQFGNFLSEFGLSDRLDFVLDFPAAIRQILDDEIIATTNGITLKSFGGLREPKYAWENRSTIEDEENHFHVDQPEIPEAKNSFALGVTTLVSLARKFKDQGFSGIRFWYVFQTPELARKMDESIGLHQEGDDYFISDRLSFHTRRENEEIINIDTLNGNSALLIIDI